jgi:hypothetical protein
MTAEISFLSPADLIDLGRRAQQASPCEACTALVCPGWESIPGGFDAGALELVGTLRDETVEEPTLAEHHPDGTHGWSADAPIAVHHFPYNRCQAWACSRCQRAFLRYTEYGGYYTDERIRAITAALVVVDAE